MTRIETRILTLYTAGSEAEAYSISEIARLAKAAYPHVHATVRRMVAEGLLRTLPVGHTRYCLPDLSSSLCRALLVEAHLRATERKRSEPNLLNLCQELQRLALADPRLLAVAYRPGTLRCLVTERRAVRDLLRRTSLIGLSFSTPDEFRKELLGPANPLAGSVVLFGYDRLLLLIGPIQEQLLLNHSALFRGRKEVRV